MIRRPIFIIMPLVFLALMGFGIASFVYILQYSVNHSQITNSIFEMIYMVVHIIICGFFAVVSIKALLTNKSSILEPIAYNGFTTKPFSTYVIAFFFLAVGLVLTILSILVLFAKVMAPGPLTIPLWLDMFNAGLNITAITTFVLTYQRLKY